MAHEDVRFFGQHFEVLVGTNEEFILGFSIKYKEAPQFSLNSTFATHSQCGSVRHLVVCGQWLLCAGVHEAIQVLNLKRRTSVGAIAEHEGAVTCLQQHRHKLLFSAAEDGRICIFTEGRWEVTRSLVGHKGVVNSVAVHPSGRLALSVGQDRMLYTWDLIKGRKAFVCSTKDPASVVLWAPSGEQYVVVADSRVDVYLVHSATIVYTVDFLIRVNAVVFITEDVIAVAQENGCVALHDVAAGATIQRWEAHKHRVRTLALMPPQRAFSTHSRSYLLTGSSDGWLRVWALQNNNLKAAPTCVSEKNTQCHITCLTVFSDEDYRQAMCSRKQELVNMRADKMLHRSQRSGTPKHSLADSDTIRFLGADQSEEELQDEHMPIQTKKRKKKRVQLPLSSESENSDVEDVTLGVIQDLDAERNATNSKLSKVITANGKPKRGRGRPPKKIYT